MTDKELYDKARIAIRDAKDGAAYLRLGILYAKGIGTNRNCVLASYFYEKAVSMGCMEALQYIEQEYQLGHRSIVKAVEKAIEGRDALSPQDFNYLSRRVEKERLSKNFGYLFSIRKHLQLFYPEYNPEKAIGDILRNRHTIDSDIMYAMSTSNIRSEVHIELQEKLLEQLFAPIISDEELYHRIIDLNDVKLLTVEEHDLLKSLENLSSSYDDACKVYDIKKVRIMEMKRERENIYPFLKVSLLPRLRWQVLRSLLSVKDADPLIRDKFLNCLDNDEQLIDISEHVCETNLQMFLICFIEFNIYMESLERSYQNLLNAYWKNDMGILASHFNRFLKRLDKAHISHFLNQYDNENLPQIQL